MDLQSDDLVTRLNPKDSGLWTSRPLSFVCIVLAVALATFAYKLRVYGPFACQAGGYNTDQYLGYCNAPDYGDYEHGAFWFDLEPLAGKFATSADAMFVGDSRMQYGFSTLATTQWFSSNGATFYLLGFIYGGNVAFEEELLLKLRPRARVYVMTIDFLERSQTLPAQDVMLDPTAHYRYEMKRLWQRAHISICRTLPQVCGKSQAIFRSRETGAYDARNSAAHEGTPVFYDHDLDQERIEKYTTSGNAFLSRLPVGRECVLLTAIPTVRKNAFVYSSSVETASAVAKDLGVNFVAPELDGLATFDGSHLDSRSAQLWSSAFFQEAGPQIRKCLAGPPASRP